METEYEIVRVRMTCHKKSCDPICHYCDRDASRKHEHDHAPIPKKSGGLKMVTACLTCHDLKDRTKFEDWPLHAAVAGARDIANYGADLLSDQWPANWDDMGTEGRILWAKIVRLRHQGGEANWMSRLGHLFPLPPQPSLFP